MRHLKEISPEERAKIAVEQEEMVAKASTKTEYMSKIICDKDEENQLQIPSAEEMRHIERLNSDISEGEEGETFSKLGETFLNKGRASKDWNDWNQAEIGWLRINNERFYNQLIKTSPSVPVKKFYL